MQTHPKGWQSWLILGILMLTLTACSTTVTQAPLEASADLSGRWNDTDSRLTAEALSQGCARSSLVPTLYSGYGAQTRRRCGHGTESHP